MRVIFGLTILVSLILLPNVAVAQTSPSADEEMSTICMPTLRLWTGAIEETQQIQQFPVPKSYKTGSGGGCGGPILAEFLVAWHLRFGNERSVKEALQFIDERDGEARLVAARIERDLSETLAKLSKEIESADAAYDADVDKDGSDPAALEKAFEQKKHALLTQGESVRRLQILKEDLQRILLVRANLYLSAAEIFKSPWLADRARTVFALHQAIETRMLPIRDGGKSKDDGDVQKALEQVQDSSIPYLTSMEIDLRLAVLQAQLNRTSETLSNARKVLERRQKAVFANAPKVAFEGGDDFCDLREETFLNDWEREVAAACKDDDAFVYKAMAYGYADTMLSILTDAEPVRHVGHWNWEDYAILVQKDAIHGSEFHGFLLSTQDRVINLKLELVDREFLNARAKVAGRWSFENAWQILMKLSPMVNPAQDPVRFRQIAERAILVGAELERENETWKRETAPMLAYFRLNLSNLDKLVLGQVP